MFKKCWSADENPASSVVHLATVTSRKKHNKAGQIYSTRAAEFCSEEAVHGMLEENTGLFGKRTLPAQEYHPKSTTPKQNQSAIDSSFAASVDPEVDSPKIQCIVQVKVPRKLETHQQWPANCAINH